MAMCAGTRNGRRCVLLLFRCKKCGNVGCHQTKKVCTSQGFVGGKCMKCGSSNKEQFKV
jgi:hypothetical protein